MKINKEINRLLRNIHGKVTVRHVRDPFVFGDKHIVKVIVAFDDGRTHIFRIENKKLCDKLRILTGKTEREWHRNRRKQVKRYLNSLPFSEYERLIKGD